MRTPAAVLARTGALSLIFVWLCVAPTLLAVELSVDCSRTNGIIRPLHGVNLGPLCYRGMVDLSAYHRELGVPFTRLHDVVWVNAEAVDIHTIFPDFRNDAARADNYDFRQTDDYVQSIVSVGSQIVYRLGESIEHSARKYHVHPPSDPEKWAAICVGIIRHYNDGWADGFHHRIKYWEIWNEPDVRPAMWTGTDEQYFRLYEITAKAIKARFPEVKIGGPGLGHSGDFAGDRFTPTAFLTNFLAHCRQSGTPLDFYSWHRYTKNPADFARWAHAVRRVLDDSGFLQTESHLNEWNYLPNGDWGPLTKDGAGVRRENWFAELSGPAGAAFSAWTLISLQEAPVDVVNYYTGEIQGFGLFNFHGVPNKSFYAFKAFKWLLDTPIRLTTGGETSNHIAICAGTNRERSAAAVLLSNFNSADDKVLLTVRHVPWAGLVLCQTYVVDAAHNLTKVRETTSPGGDCSVTVELKAPSIALVKLLKAGAETK